MLTYLTSLPDWLLNTLLGVEAVIVIAFLVWQVRCNILNTAFFHEEIACASIKFADIGVLSLPAPARHPHIMWARLLFMGTPMHDCVQGFLTTEGRFVTRQQAWKIAEKRGQIVEVTGNPGTLYSEDLWPSIPAARGYTIINREDDE